MGGRRPLARDEEIQAHRDLSAEYLRTAHRAREAGDLAPAQHNATHALELAVKAALRARLERIPRTHNVAGEFGRLFRGDVGIDIAKDVARFLHDYDAPRYPDSEHLELADLDALLAFVDRFCGTVLPALVASADQG